MARNRIRRFQPLVLLVSAGLLAFASQAQATSGYLPVASDTTLAEDHQGQIEVVADGVTLDCAGHRVTGSDFAGILLQGRQGVTVRNCDVSGFFHGIAVLAASKNTLRQNTTHDNVGAGIVLDQQSTGNLIAANAVRGNGHNGIQISFSHRNVITGNRAERNAGTGGIALGQANENLVTANASTGNAAFGISVEGASNRVIGNTARSNGAPGGFEAGIVVFPSSRNTLVAANHVAENNQGIRLEDATGSIVIGNHAVANGEGIRVQGAIGSTLIANRADRNRAWGFVIAGSPGTVLESNVATGNESLGFALNNTSDTTLTRNVAHRNGHSGFEVFESNDNLLRGNTSTQNGIGGFSIVRSSGNKLSGNTARNNGTPNNGPGFELNDASGNELKANKAFDNGSTGFFAFGTSENNVIAGNTGCRNHFFDGGDFSTGAGNTWTGNSFCVTAGI